MLPVELKEVMLEIEDFYISTPYFIEEFDTEEKREEHKKIRETHLEDLWNNICKDKENQYVFTFNGHNPNATAIYKSVFSTMFSTFKALDDRSFAKEIRNILISILQLHLEGDEYYQIQEDGKRVMDLTVWKKIIKDFKRQSGYITKYK